MAQTNSTINIINKNFNIKLYGKLSHQDMLKDKAMPDFYIGYKNQKTKGRNGITYKSVTEQYGKIVKIFECENGNFVYQMDYGHYNFHESFLPIERLRKLTEQEITFHKNNEFWKLPQRFYQSVGMD